MNSLLKCLRKEKSSNIPIWFMRQAGRYLPEFRKIREKNKNFIKLCLNQKLVSKLSLQPIKRFDLDAVIVFSDILMIPYGLGQKVQFKKDLGPILGNLNLKSIIETNKADFIKNLMPIYKSIRNIKKNIGKDKCLIGFVGSPWTLLIYMLHKKSPKKNFNLNKIIKDKFLTEKLLSKLGDVICLHIDKQIEAGAQVIQIFDSWAGLLTKENLPNYCYIPNLKIVEHIKSKKIPVICFPKGIKENYVEFCSIVKPNCISIDYTVDPKWIRNKLNGMPVQGGLDPNILLNSKQKILNSVNNYLKIFADYPYIFNLGHGVLPNTNPETIDYIVKIVRNEKSGNII